MPTSIPEIISNCRKTQNMSLREFATALSEPMKERGGKISHQAVKNWEKGALPSFFWMISLTLAIPDKTDWRFKLAMDVLAVLKPEIWRLPEAFVKEHAE